jgi:hypothetical protein
VLAAVGVVVIVGFVIGGLFLSNGGDPKTKPKPVASATVPPKAPAPLKFTVSSYTTSGDGFRDKGNVWDTHTYKTTKFGNLKPGVGLVLDLGSAKEVTSVSFNAETGPMKVELHSADAMPTGTSGGKIVGEATTANGKTVLDASKGGKHQYWMIWVTELGPTRKAVISGISAAAVPAP